MVETAHDCSAQLRAMQELLDEEIGRLPEAERQALVHCYLEGHTRDEAARLQPLLARSILHQDRSSSKTTELWARPHLISRIQLVRCRMRTAEADQSSLRYGESF